MYIKYLSNGLVKIGCWIVGLYVAVDPKTVCHTVKKKHKKKHQFYYIQLEEGLAQQVHSRGLTRAFIVHMMQTISHHLEEMLIAPT